MSREKIVDGLYILLANTYALYLKTQNYHWNIEGQNFISLHKLFEDQYKDLADASDEIAERIRALDAKVPASFSKFDQSSTIGDGDENANFEKMLLDLIEDHLTLVDILYKLIEIAVSNNDKCSEDLAISRIRIHEKNIWMLRASHEFDTIRPGNVG